MSDQNEINPLKIRLLFDCPAPVKESNSLYIASLEASLATLIPKAVLKNAPDPGDTSATREFFNNIYEELPLAVAAFGDKEPYIVSLRFLATSKNVLVSICHSSWKQFLLSIYLRVL